MGTSFRRGITLWFASLIFSVPAFALTQWEVQQLDFTTTQYSSQQWAEFPLRVRFTHADKVIELDGYPTDGNQWSVRFALPLAGTWTWQVISSSGFSGSGSLIADAPTSGQVSANPNYRGHIRVAGNGRYFTYADGTPFVYLGDTNWRMSSSPLNDFYTWAADRDAKKFTVMQIAAVDNQPNEGGTPFQSSDWSLVNPAFFAAADTRFQHLWDRGFVVAMHPAWFPSMLSLVQAQDFSRYLMARYGAYNIVWSLAGEFQDTGGAWVDNNYAMFRSLGNAVKSYDAYGHPISVHPGGYDVSPTPVLERQNSYHYFHSEPWLDHNWVQTFDRTDAIVFRMQQGYGYVPAKPVIEAEPCYETATGGYVTDSSGGWSRVTCDDGIMRRQSWASVLSGAGGYVYGAVGVYYLDNMSALSFSGSSRIPHLSDFLTRLGGWQLDPTLGCAAINGSVSSNLDTRHPICAGNSGRFYAMYIPSGNQAATLEARSLANRAYTAYWYDPRQGGSYVPINGGAPVNSDLDDRWTLPSRPSPSNDDWVLILVNAHTVPGTIQAEDFDEGGEAVGYHDTDAGNNAGSHYRSSDVDIQPTQDTGGGYDIGWTSAGEWLNYTVDVASAGSYTLEVRVASNGPGGRFHVEFGGVDKTGAITAPDTGGWQNWQTISRTVTLAAGPQTMRLVMDAVSSATESIANINYVRLTATGAGAHAIPGTVQAEDFDEGGEGVAYHDLDSGNNAGSYYRSTDVDIQPTQDSGGGYDIGWTRATEWLNYTVNVASAGTYTLEVRVASDGPGGTFHVEFGGVDKTGSMVVPNTGGWQSWQTISRTVTLSAGQQAMRIVMDSEGATTQSIGNINYVRVTASAPGPVAQWGLDDGSGSTALDSSGGGRNGTLVNGPVWTTGRFGGALQFNGLNQYVGISSAAVGNQTAFTVSAWVRMSSAQKGKVYIERGSGNQAIFLSINENAVGDAEFGVIDDAGGWGGISVPASGLNDGNWHLLVGVQRTKFDREFYVDGQSVGVNATIIGNVTLTAAQIGTNQALADFLQGSVDDVRVYDRALSTTEIQSLYNGTL